MRSEIVLADAELARLSEESRSLAVQAFEFSLIRDEAQRNAALEFGIRIKRARQFISDMLDKPIADAFALHRGLTSRRKTMDDPLADADIAVRRSIGTFEDNKRREIEAKRQAELAEARRKAEVAEAERQAQMAAARKAEEDRRLAEAQKLADAGKQSAADAMLAAPIAVVPPPVVKVEAPVTPVYRAPEGTRTTTTWKFRIIDEAAIPREYLKVDDVKIGGVVRSTKGEIKIPGIEAYPETKSNF